MMVVDVETIARKNEFADESFRCKGLCISMESKVPAVCPSCGQKFRVSATIIGRKVRCKSCKAPFVAQDVTNESSYDDALSVDLSLDSSSQDGQISPVDPPPLGQIGDFRLLEILGGGAFGLVYKALDTKLGRMVAIKVPRFSLDDKSKSRRFLNEAKTAARLRHPNIVALYESGVTDDGQMFLVSEFVEGKTLLEHVRKGSLGLKKKVGWIRDLARAIHVAHTEGIVHRDIKSENILVSEADHRPQITDFGLAKMADDNSSIQTQDGSLLGTPAYMSPEQARGDIDNIGPLSDLYSLGVVLFECLSGKRPYRGRPHEVIAAVAATTAPPQVNEFNSKLPGELVAICAKAMHKQPASRFQSGEEFADDLDRWLNGKPVLARQDNGFRSKRNVLIGASLLACLLVLGALAFFWNGDSTEQTVASNGTVATGEMESESADENAVVDQSMDTVVPPETDVGQGAQESLVVEANEGADDSLATVTQPVMTPPSAKPLSSNSDAQAPPAAKPQMEADKRWKELEQKLDTAISNQDLPTLLSVYDELKKEPRLIPESQRLLDKATQEKDRLAKQLADSNEEQRAKELTTRAIDRFTRGDEFGAYVLVRGLPDTVRESKAWEQRKATLEQIVALESTYRLMPQGNFLGTRKTSGTADITETQQTVTEIRQYDRDSQFAALRVFVENESVESSLFVDAKDGDIWFDANSMGGMEEVKSGEIVLIGTHKGDYATEVTLTGLRHRPVKIQLQMNKGGLYRGALILEEAKREELGELVVQLKPEPGLDLKKVDLSQAHLWVSPMGFYSPKFPINNEGVFGPMLLYPQNYSLQAVHPADFTSEPRRHDVQVAPLKTTTIDLPVFLPRDVSFEWVYRDGDKGPWQTGSTTIPSGTRSHYFKDWTKAARLFWISLSGWSTQGMQLDWANAEVLQVNPPAWPPAENFGPFPQKGKPFPREYPLTPGLTVAVWRPGVFQAVLRVSKIEPRPQE